MFILAGQSAVYEILVRSRVDAANFISMQMRNVGFNLNGSSVLVNTWKNILERNCKRCPQRLLPAEFPPVWRSLEIFD